MNSQIFGLIIYKLAKGNPEGRWMNNLVTAFQVEKAIRNSGGVNGFIGTYRANLNKTSNVNSTNAHFFH